MKMKAVIIFGFAFLLLAGAIVGRASGSESDRQSLKGLKGVEVLVEDFSPGTEQAGLTKSSIQTDVELKLRLARIPVSSPVGETFLYVQLTVVNPADAIWTYGINVELYQMVFLARDPTIKVTGSTWSTSVVGSVGKSNVQQIRDRIKDQVDQFINAYLSVNPK